MAEASDFGVALAVARALEEAGIEYLLGGSLASSLHGEARATNDVDFAVRIEERQVEPFAARLGADFEVDPEGLREAIRHRGSHNLFYLPTVLKIDLFVRGGEPFDESEFTRRRRMTLRDGRALYVSSPEDSLLRKLKWFQLGNEISDRQWRDVLGILRISGSLLDFAYVQEWAGRLGLTVLLERARGQAESR